jgi:hypothetical protein
MSFSLPNDDEQSVVIAFDDRLDLSSAIKNRLSGAEGEGMSGGLHEQ